MKYWHCKGCGEESTSKSGMMVHAFNELMELRETLTEKKCGECGTQMEKTFDKIPHENNTNWYCPKCKAGTL